MKYLLLTFILTLFNTFLLADGTDEYDLYGDPDILMPSTFSCGSSTCQSNQVCCASILTRDLIWANVAQWQSSCFVNSRSAVQIRPLAPEQNYSYEPPIQSKIFIQLEYKCTKYYSEGVKNGGSGSAAIRTYRDETKGTWAGRWLSG